MVWKVKALIIFFVLNVILDYLKKTVHNLFAITKNASENVHFLVKLQALKMNSFTRIFQVF